MTNMRTKVNTLATKGCIKGMQAKAKIRGIFEQKSGEGFVDTALVRHVSI